MYPLILLDIIFPGIAVFAASFVSSLLLLFYFLHFAGCIVVFLYLVFLFQLVLSEDACRDAVRKIPPSWSLIKWLCQKPSWNCFSIELFARLATRSRKVFPFSTTTAFGPYVNSFSEFTHYAFGSVCATSALRTLALHFGLGAEQACSAAARVTSSLPISGVSLRRRLVLPLASFTRRFLTPGFAACGPSSDVVRSPFFTAYLFLAALPYSQWVLLLGRRTCFPSAVDLAYSHRFQYVLSLPYSFRGVPAYRGGRTCFPTAVEYMAKFTFQYFRPFPLACILADRV